VTGTRPPQTATQLFAGLLTGETIACSAFLMTPDEFLRACREQELVGLTYERLRGLPEPCDWPQDIREALAMESRAQAAKELLRRKEVVSVLDALAAEGVYPLLLKGTALAYSFYGSPASRPRVDTDLLIQRSQIDRARRVMARCGYTTPTYCDGDLLFCQFPLKKTDAFGLTHAFDFHWKISTQSMFAEILSEEELAPAAVPVPALGPHARAVGPVHALLLACIHPVMHHRNTDSLIWIYDVHLIASGLSDAELERFAELAIDKRVAAICAERLALARSRFRTRLPERVVARLGEPRALEPSEVYLRPSRRWHHELLSNLRGLGRSSERARLLREVLVPGPRYMLDSYGFGAIGYVLLPALYVHRIMNGVWKILRGRK
jgi:hypothetical protein